MKSNGGVPGLPEIEETGRRREARFGRSPDPETARLMRVYDALAPRFAADLSDRSDHTLLRGAALTSVKSLVEPPPASPSAGK
jgi:hypothetical protein